PRMAHDSEAFLHLAQNPLLFAQEPFRDAFLSQWSWTPRHMPGAMTVEEAVQVAQETLGRGASFPSPQYPLVKATNERVGVRFKEPVNVVLIFVEGLDRRFLGRTIDGSDSSSQTLRLKSFIDNLIGEYLYLYILL